WSGGSWRDRATRSRGRRARSAAWSRVGRIRPNKRGAPPCNGPRRCGIWAFAPRPVASPAPRGATAAGKGGRLKLAVVRKIRAGHPLGQPLAQQSPRRAPSVDLGARATAARRLKSLSRFTTPAVNQARTQRVPERRLHIFGAFFRNTPATIMRCGRTFRLARTHPAHARLSGSETLSRTRSLVGYTIDTHESEFSEVTTLRDGKRPLTPPAIDSHRLVLCALDKY